MSILKRAAPSPGVAASMSFAVRPTTIARAFARRRADRERSIAEPDDRHAIADDIERDGPRSFALLRHQAQQDAIVVAHRDAVSTAWCNAARCHVLTRAA